MKRKAAMTTEEKIVQINNLRLLAQGVSIVGGVMALVGTATAYYAMARGNVLTALDKGEKATAAAARDAVIESEKAVLRAEVVDLKGQLGDATFQRVLTDRQKAKLLADMTAFFEDYQEEWNSIREITMPAQIFIAHEDDEETRLFAKQISEVLAQAGFIGTLRRKDNLPPKLADFEVTYPANETQTKTAEFVNRMTDRLKGVLEGSGFKVALRQNQYYYDHSMDILVRRRDSRDAPTPPVDPTARLTIFPARD